MERNLKAFKLAEELTAYRKRYELSLEELRLQLAGVGFDVSLSSLQKWSNQQRCPAITAVSGLRIALDRLANLDNELKVE